MAYIQNMHLVGNRADITLSFLLNLLRIDSLDIFEIGHKNSIKIA